MLTLPAQIIELFNPFAPVFHGETTWEKAKLLLIGTVLTPGKRTVSAALRVMGLKDDGNFAKYHHVLNRAVWSPLAVGERLLLLLIRTFCTEGDALIFGIDETIERRYGRKIAARGIYRDPVHSSKSHFVKASGLRWISVMLLTRIPWAQRIWALPVLSALAPSERYYQEHGRQAKTLTERGKQMIFQVRRWLPDPPIVFVGDSTYAALDLLAACQGLTNPVTFITRLRMDAALYEPAPPYSGRGRPRKKGKRLPTPQHYLDAEDMAWTTIDLHWYDGQLRAMELASGTAVWFHYGKPAVPIRWVLIRDPLNQYETVCLLCTDLTVDPKQIAQWFVMRWQLEVTFEEARRHLGVETQRQWSDKAIARTTPTLFGLFSWITLLADAFHASSQPVMARQSAWYAKALPTFSDALALVRTQLWACLSAFQTSRSDPDMINVSRSYISSLVETLCYAA
jgi:hypothetical protein